uniref:Sugar phosphate transporter domain-containing protein n=1 Tax=Dunaliella tertiolecta TaxID=3047 RepID=A0A7S3QMB6_DUNTE
MSSSSTATTISVIIIWYATNILVLLGNKFLLSNTGFRQPVFLTLCHMTACMFLGIIISASGWIPVKPLKSRMQLVKVSILAVIFCSTIVLGNASLKYLHVSFTQAIGATTPFFTALLAYFFQGARENMTTYMALVPVVVGVIIASGGEPNFHVLGFTLAMLAVAGRALKSVVQSILMSDPTEKLDPMSLLTYMSTVCVALLLPLTLLLEPTAFNLAHDKFMENPNFAWWMIVNAMFAYLTNLFNFLVTKYTSALTLQVLGNAKGVVAAVVSVLVFANPVTLQGGLGYALTFMGVCVYSEAKRRFNLKREVHHEVGVSSPKASKEGWRAH